jgi:hypothetical protein
LLVLCFAFASPACPFVSVCASSQRMGTVAVVAKNLDMYIYIQICPTFFADLFRYILTDRSISLSSYVAILYARVIVSFCVSLHALRSQMEVSTHKRRYQLPHNSRWLASSVKRILLFVYVDMRVISQQWQHALQAYPIPKTIDAPGHNFSFIAHITTVAQHCPYQP